VRAVVFRPEQQRISERGSARGGAFCYSHCAWHEPEEQQVTHQWPPSALSPSTKEKLVDDLHHAVRAFVQGNAGNLSVIGPIEIVMHTAVLRHRHPLRWAAAAANSTREQIVSGVN
jgi:hypothetical protein